MATAFQFSANNINYDDIQTELKDYFESLGYEFIEGGNYSNLIKVLSYITLLNGQYMSNTINNLFLSSATTKESIYLLAKQIGYVPRRKMPSRTRIIATFTPTTYTADTFTIASISFTGKNNTYTYIGTNVLFTIQSDGTYKADFTAEEKELKSIEYYGTNEINQEIILPTDDIAKDLFTLKSDIGSTSYDWELINSFTDFPDNNARIYYIELNAKDEVKIIFGNNVYGQSPDVNEKIEVEYYITKGLDGNAETEFELVSLLSNDGTELNNISKYSFSFGKSYGGSDYESIKEIQTIAPKNFSSLNNHITTSDFDSLIEISNDYTAFANQDTVYYTTSNLLGETFLSLVPLSYRNESATKEDDYYPNGTFPISEIDELVSTSTTYSNITQYYNGWIYLNVISPTYLYLDITPHIEIKDDKTFVNVAHKVFTELLDDVEDEYYTSNIFGFNKKYRDSTFYKTILENTDVISSEVETELSIITNKDNIIDKNFLKIPNDFLQTNEKHFNNLKTHSTYLYDELLLEDSTIYCDTLKDSSLSSGNEFSRYIASNDKILSNTTSKIFELEFDTDGTIINKDILSIYINKKLVNCNLFYNDINAAEIKNFTNEKIPLIYSQDNISDAVSSYNYNYTRTENTWFLYFNYLGINYLVGEIIEILDPDKYYIFKEVDNKYAIQKMFELTGLTQYTTSDFLEYTSNKILTTENNNTIDKYIVTGNISFSFGDTLTQNRMNLRLTSRKKIASIVLTTGTPEVTIDDSAIFSYDTTSTQIKLSDDTDFDSGNNIATFTYDSFSITLSDTLAYQDIPNYTYYKDNKFSIIKNASVFEIYAHEIYDDISLANIDIDNGILEFNKNVIYYEDYNDSSNYSSITLSLLLDEIFDSSSIYKLKMVSQNQIGNLLNTNESFDTDGTTFILPNLNHIQEIS